MVVPTMNYIAGEIRAQLAPEFYGEREDIWMDFDYSKVKALLEDENALYERMTKAYEKGWLKRSEVRAQADYQSGPEDEAYRPEPAPSAFGFASLGRKELGEPWDDREIARYFRALAPERYADLITAEADDER